MIVQARSARPQIILGGIDFYNQLAPYLLHFEWTDSCDGHKADDCQFSLADRDRKFINAWMPAPGATFDAAIICERWFSPNAAALVLPCGSFYIDSIEFDLPEHTVHVKASSIPNDAHGKTSNETRGWGEGGGAAAGAQGGTSLFQIAQQIATDNHLQFVPLTTTNPQYDRVEQVQESAFQFLKRLAEDAKLEIKIAKNQLWLYDPLTLDQAPPTFTLVYGDAPGAGRLFRMSGGKFRLQVTDLTASTVVSNTDIQDGMTTSRQFDANSLLPPQVGGTGGGASPQGQSPLLPGQWKDNLNWNTDRKSTGGNGSGGSQREGEGGNVGLQYFSDDSGQADAALTKAQARTRDKNKRQYESDIEMSIGNPLVTAGETFVLSGCGQFDGPWFIETARHEVCPMYKTTLHVRRTLGY